MALKPDCVLYMQEGFDLDDLTRLLGSGINVVTTRSEFFYAAAMDPTVRHRVEQACQQGGSSIHATGSSPGFSTTTMPLTLVYPMRRLDELTIDEYADIPASVGPDMITKVMRFGTPVDKTEMDPRLLEGQRIGYKQSLAAFADAIGPAARRLRGARRHRARHRAVHPLGRFSHRERHNGGPANHGRGPAQRQAFLTFRAHWFCTPHLDPDWNISGEGWLFTTKGDAPMQVRVTYGRTDEGYSEHLAGYTAHPAVNAIPYVVEAKPGIRTIFDLPPMVSRFDPNQ